uniref:Uncharacterized protein n=1 Tax=Rhizophora mucronata TaxID=61149 RepID=A0A2P2PXQ3_RHIMU
MEPGTSSNPLVNLGHLS